MYNNFEKILQKIYFFDFDLFDFLIYRKNQLVIIILYIIYNTQFKLLNLNSLIQI
jgi:hypothetical protein